MSASDDDAANVVIVGALAGCGLSPTYHSVTTCKPPIPERASREPEPLSWGPRRDDEPSRLLRLDVALQYQSVGQCFVEKSATGAKVPPIRDPKISASLQPDHRAD